MSLQNLETIAKEIKDLYSTYEKEEVLLSNEFKDKYKKLIKSINNDDIFFSEFTSLIVKPNKLTITLPNQWFYIASFFVPLYKNIMEYKEQFNIVFGDQQIDLKDKVKQIKETGQIPENIESKIDSLIKNEQDRKYFKEFISNYKWWGGSKTIDRGDFYVSPILSFAEVVNASQSYISDITVILAENEDVLEALKLSKISKSKTYISLDAPIIKSDSIRDFAYNVFNYFYSDNWNTLLEKCNFTLASINETSFESFDIKNLKRVVSKFNKAQDKNSLSSSGTLRYFEKPIFIEGSSYYYFSTQWNGNDERDLNFVNLKIYIESEFPNFKLEKIGGVFYLRKHAGMMINCEEIHKVLTNSGLKFSLQIVQRFVASLLTKPFVICSGLSGSGKTKLAQAFVQWISESDQQYKIIPVGSDWTNREPLLGYPNGLKNNSYVTPDSGALQLILEASKEINQNKPYFMILDEMNLSHVERYFADFLSVMESGETIKLYSGDDRYTKFSSEGVPDELSLVPKEITWPRNLFIVGTVNIDETTYMFSPKVLDRANVIEFRIKPDEMEGFLMERKEIDMKQLFVNNDKNKGGLGQGMGESFLLQAGIKSTNKSSELKDKLVILNKFFEELQNVGAEFGYRTATEIELLISKLSLEEFKDIDGEPLSIDSQIDIAIMQKLLPKLHGSRKKLIGPLETLAGFCIDRVNSKPDEQNKNKTIYQQYITENKDTSKWKKKYQISLEKIERMHKNVIDNGFTSYAEA